MLNDGYVLVNKKVFSIYLYATAATTFCSWLHSLTVLPPFFYASGATFMLVTPELFLPVMLRFPVILRNLSYRVDRWIFSPVLLPFCANCTFDLSTFL